MDPESLVVELRLTYRYATQHPWVVQAVNGFLSAYFMDQPGFRVQRHFDELESGMHVWLCEVPAPTTMSRLLRRLKADIPPFRHTEVQGTSGRRPQYLIDAPESASASEALDERISP
ncbi:MAG TPA: hypothetical protein VJL88_14670 [Nitrospira sp.]|nr:hypothetical protein [Nitrospira sp.]